MVKHGSKRIMVFPPCTTVLVYVTYSTAQVHHRLCGYVYAWTDVPAHTHTHTHTHTHVHNVGQMGKDISKDKWTLSHTSTKTHNHTRSYTHAPAPPPTHTHTHTHTCTHTRPRVHNSGQMGTVTHISKDTQPHM
jgi:hypothetical protein